MSEELSEAEKQIKENDKYMVETVMELGRIFTTNKQTTRQPVGFKTVKSAQTVITYKTNIALKS